MSTLSKDARGFVEGVVSFMEGHGKKSTATEVESLLTRVTDQAKKEKSARIDLTVTPTKDEKIHIESLIAKLLGHSVDVDYTVDPALVAGLSIRVADWILDTSFRGQLEQMRQIATS